ncbi:interferon-stimulated gene 20 kDa protein isoform X2 [Lynx rufus]|uniref:interferon-stimulated gene 20 kDa protein isoform X2 n=1 Tax=Lynx rufus TaxID=61384 RepID=UPI001F124FB1|nr:interferon-stimulated gene 20 kDa protein isoform X2 [Lynx rufus]
MESGTEVVAIDCEMVGLGPRGESGLARCSLVDLHGTVLYDKFIRPEGEITDYRTLISGITPWHMQEATPFAVARLEMSKLRHKAEPTVQGRSRAETQILAPELALGCSDPTMHVYTRSVNAEHPVYAWDSARHPTFEPRREKATAVICLREPGHKGRLIPLHRP